MAFIFYHFFCFVIKSVCISSPAWRLTIVFRPFHDYRPLSHYLSASYIEPLFHIRTSPPVDIGRVAESQKIN